MTLLRFKSGRTYDLSTYSDKRLMSLLDACVSDRFVTTERYRQMEAAGTLPTGDRAVSHCESFDTIYEEAVRRGLDLTNVMYRP